MHTHDHVSTYNLARIENAWSGLNHHHAHQALRIVWATRRRNLFDTAPQYIRGVSIYSHCTSQPATFIRSFIHSQQQLHHTLYYTTLAYLHLQIQIQKKTMKLFLTLPLAFATLATSVAVFSPPTEETALAKPALYDCAQTGTCSFLIPAQMPTTCDCRKSRSGVSPFLFFLQHPCHAVPCLLCYLLHTW